jgi:hypothetical protein
VALLVLFLKIIFTNRHKKIHLTVIQELPTWLYYVGQNGPSGNSCGSLMGQGCIAKAANESIDL